MIPPEFAKVVQSYFSDHLLQDKRVSAGTLHSYRDTFHPLLQYLSRHPRKKPVQQLGWIDLNAPAVLGFLRHLEQQRGNSARTRNARLAAIRSFVRYALAFKHPEYLPVVQQILAIPLKRFARPLLGFLSRQEMQAVLDATQGRAWSDQRDHLLFTLLYNTGARISEIVQLRVQDVREGSLQVHGKGRKDRVVPLWRNTVRLLRQWIRLNHLQNDQPLLTNRWGQALTRAGAAHRLHRAVQKAAVACPSLKHRRISPHTPRHTTAMHLLQAGVNLEVIALWLGHESPVTTHHYVEADLAMKQQALQRIQPPHTKATPFRPKPDLLRFLEAL